MKKIIASVGLVALGAVSSQAQYAPGLTPQETSKPWSVSASLRGFYDDNYLTLPKTIPNPGYGVPGQVNNGTLYVQGARSSWGLEFSPSASYNHSVEETLFSASYVYDLRWYQDQSSVDQTHEFNTRLEHTFSERYKLAVNDSFVIAQIPTVIDPSVVSSPLYTPGSNVRNTGSIDFTAELSPMLDLHAGYANTMYAYQQTEGDVVVFDIPGETRFPSRSALLDRMEQIGTLDLRWKMMPQTTGILGYQYEHINYTSPEGIIFSSFSPASATAYSNIRNTDSHFAFLGVDQSFTPQLNASLRAGAQYVDYYNFHTDLVSPYADASMTYSYMQGSYLQVGVKNIHNSTDVVGFYGSAPVLDAESTAVYFSLTQAIASRVTCSLLGQYQNSRFVGGQYGNVSDDFFIAGLNFAYHFNPFLLMEAGYNYNKLNSAIPFRGYTENQVYVGVRGSY